MWKLQENFSFRSYFIPIQRPNLFRLPCRVSGTPVVREILRLALVTPNARFQEKVSPGPSFMLQTYLNNLGHIRGTSRIYPLVHQCVATHARTF